MAMTDQVVGSTAVFQRLNEIQQTSRSFTASSLVILSRPMEDATLGGQLDTSRQASFQFLVGLAAYLPPCRTAIAVGRRESAMH